MTMIDPQYLVGMGEIAALAGVSAQAVTNWRNRDADFPKPVAVLMCGAIFDRREVEKWLDRKTATQRRYVG